LDPVAPENIALIQKWIDDGCPEDPVTSVTAAFGWRPTNAPVASSRTDDIWFIDPQVGWAVNSNGQILKTCDGGDSWTEQLHDQEVYLRCLGFASPTRGWAGALTLGKALFETRDGGSAWTPVANLPTLAPSAVCGMSVVDKSVVYVSGTNFPNRPPRMAKTTDDGGTWTAWDMTPWASILIDTFFTSPARGWVVGGKTDEPRPTRANVKPVVLFTEDSGRTWVNRVANIQDQLPQGEWGWKIQFLNERIGFVSLENFSQGAILKTTDGGQTWDRLPVNDSQKNSNLEGVGFVDENHGWVGGWGDVEFARRSSSETSDGGRTWRDANSIGKALNRFRFFGNPVTVGYASGETVYKYAAGHPPAALAHLGTLDNRSKFFGNREPLHTVGSVRVPVVIPKAAGRLSVRIWDRFGDLVCTLIDETDPVAGERIVEWDRSNTGGQTQVPGYFIWRVTVDQVSESRLVCVTEEK